MNIIDHITLRHGSDVKVLALVLLLCAPVLHAQRNNMRFDHITSEQGLSDNYVLSILQDRYGFMWFGTRDGLNRYDGYHFTIYRHSPGIPGSLSDGSVNCIFEDREGTLWVGTHSGGINRFERERRQFTHFLHQPGNPGSIARGRVSSMCEDDNGDLWIGAAGPEAGLSRFDRKRNVFVRYHHDSSDINSLSSDNITCVCRDHNGNIWIATEGGGLNRFDFATGTFINYHHDPQLAFGTPGSVHGLASTPDGNLWVRSSNTVFVLRSPYPGMGSTVEPVRFALHSPNTVHRDRSGKLWFCTFLNGVYVSDGNQGILHHAYYNPADINSIISNRALCIYEDNQENIWIGTDRGINKLNRRNWNFDYYRHDPFDSNSLSDWVVRSISRDTKGVLWIGTGGGGLDRVDPDGERITHYTRNPEIPGSLSDNTVNKIYEDRQGTLWIGSNDGLNRFDSRTGRFKHYMYRPNDSTTLPQGGIWEILEDDVGNFWIGTLGGGVSLFDREKGTFRRFLHDARDPSSLSHDYVLCMFQDRKHGLWIGTDEGLNYFDRRTKRFTRYLHDEHDPGTISNNRVWYIHEDRDGIFWIATSGGGLNRFDPATGKFRAYTENDGLANNTVCAILEDRYGRLWISTNNGISRFNRSTGTFRNYTALDGLYISEFHFKTCHADSDGFLYFGGSNGIIRFHPDSIDERSSVPPLVLTSFQVFDADHTLDTCISLKRIVRLPHDSSFFSIGFAALDFTSPQGTRYRYRLEGFDDDWRETDGTDSRAHYTAIPAGFYTFRVESSGADGIWNSQGASLVVIIEPAFWETWWFLGLAIIVVLATALSIARTRIGNIRRKGELERRLVEYRLQALRAQMNPHFIFNSLNSILHFIVHHDPEAAHRYLSKFSKLMRMTLEHSKNESISLADEIESLKFYIELESVRFDDGFSYMIRVADNVNPAAVQLPPMLIQPHVENAIKHGLTYRETEGRLLIDIREHGQWIICSVEDNGIGRNVAALMKAGESLDHRSRGIEITRERLDVFTSLNGGSYNFDVEDLMDEQGAPTGTRVNIRIPKKPT